MIVIVELHFGQLQLAVLFDVDLAGAVDQDIGHFRVGEKWLERTEPHDLVFDFLDDPAALVQAQRRGFFREKALHDFANFRPRPLFLDRADQRQVHDL